MDINNIPNKKLWRPVVLRIISLLMLFSAIPMLWWCLNLINAAALTYEYAGVGCFIASLLYLYSILTSISGLIFAKRPHRYNICRILAYIQLIVAIITIIPLSGYFFLTLPPILLLTILFMFIIGWRNKKGGAYYG